MSTTASTYTGPEISLEKIKQAVDELCGLPWPQREIRLHPDDLAELRLRHRERVVNFNGMLLAGNFGGSLLGLPVVEDLDAPRLPCKPRE